MTRNAAAPETFIIFIPNTTSGWVHPQILHPVSASKPEPADCVTQPRTYSTPPQCSRLSPKLQDLRISLNLNPIHHIGYTLTIERSLRFVSLSRLQTTCLAWIVRVRAPKPYSESRSFQGNQSHPHPQLPPHWYRSHHHKEGLRILLYRVLMIWLLFLVGCVYMYVYVHAHVYMHV